MSGREVDLGGPWSPPATWVTCEDPHSHPGPFRWVTTAGFDEVDEPHVAAALIYDHGVDILAEQSA